MKQSQAVRLLTTIAAAFRTTIPDETLKIWSESLMEFEQEDALEAVMILAESSLYLPALADLRSTIIECRNDRLKAERVALPEGTPPKGISFAEFLATNPEYRARVEALEGNTVGVYGLSGILLAEMGKLSS